MKTVILDAKTLGDDMSFSSLEKVCSLTVYGATAPGEIQDRARGAECIIINKVKLTAEILEKLPYLKLICITATGFDNVDVKWCSAHGVAVCNVCGYSTQSVALITVSLALSLINHLPSFDSYVKSGLYTQSGIQNKLTPVFHEPSALTWGVIGYGDIGKEVARIAESFGFSVLYCRNTPDGAQNCVNIDELLTKSDVVSLHVPANAKTVNLINKERLEKMRDGAVLVNAARGAVTDEAAVADAVLSGKLSGFATDVYTTEPFPCGHPFEKLRSLDNVVFTPHMAWGAYEARVRLISEVALNISAFLSGSFRNRVD